MITAIIVCIIVIWWARPKIDHKEVVECERHEWIEDRNGRVYSGLYCKHCFKRPG